MKQPLRSQETLIDPSNIPRFAAVVFDMDGVIVDSEPVHFDSTVRMMTDDFGIPFTEAENSEFLGSTDRHMWEVLRERHRLAPTVDDLIDRRKTIYLGLLDGGLPWRDGIRDLIAELDRSNYRLAVASSALRHVIEYVIREGSLGRHFETVVSGEDAAHPKPAPDIYLEAARRLDLAPDRCVAIEDTNLGVRAAHTAGMHVIAFPNMTTRDADFSLADRVLENTTEIRHYILNDSPA